MTSPGPGSGPDTGSSPTTWSRSPPRPPDPAAHPRSTRAGQQPSHDRIGVDRVLQVEVDRSRFAAKALIRDCDTVLGTPQTLDATRPKAASLLEPRRSAAARGGTRSAQELDGGEQYEQSGGDEQDRHAGRPVQEHEDQDREGDGRDP